ncbi:replication initiator protein [Klebsiella pneumoniae]|uniref:hypothetical protein n=1 Tax=Klebsiella pneumoniae TaxID=573 RepID=UPI000E2CE818|nr:hypothetical protein [Klebsiella pneumoniae]SXP29048.1 replication initiator protein [Klebsiella pneumoniae]
MGSCTAPSAKGDDKFITTDYLQQCRQQYIVDTFLVVVFGGAQSLLGTLASAFAISQSQSTLEFFLSGSMAKVITLLIVVGILLLRPQGLFANRVRR